MDPSTVLAVDFNIPLSAADGAKLGEVTEATDGRSRPHSLAFMEHSTTA